MDIQLFITIQIIWDIVACIIFVKLYRKQKEFNY